MTVTVDSGSGTDVFVACVQVGPQGHVIGIDFTPEQLDKARALAEGLPQAEFRAGRIERLPVEHIKTNPYEFISDRARNASANYGVKSVSLLARKEQ